MENILSLHSGRLWRSLHCEVRRFCKRWTKPRLLINFDIRLNLIIEKESMTSNVYANKFSPGTQWTQHGIVSFGAASGCEAGLPAGYTRYLECSKDQQNILLKNRTETYLDWILSETGIEEPTEAPATTPTTTVPTEPPTTLPPFICPEGWVDSKTGCFKLLHTEVKKLYGAPRIQTVQVVNRHEALVACEAIGGYLAEPKSSEQASFLVGHSPFKEHT